ncbi:hypothetical protein [Burkholderia gladioli]|uniref:hypothetical protein n=1 Tax=Burkholderia gladioli TaxID=28095 RepID=UPI0016415EFC|nr:hypothetical protein [Burkholderia gladioli]
MTHIVEKRIFEIQCRLIIRLCVSCMIALLLGKARVPRVNGSNRHAFSAALSEWRRRAGRRHPKLPKIGRKPCWARLTNGCTGRDARCVPVIERAN